MKDVGFCGPVKVLQIFFKYLNNYLVIQTMVDKCQLSNGVAPIVISTFWLGVICILILHQTYNRPPCQFIKMVLLGLWPIICLDSFKLTVDQLVIRNLTWLMLSFLELLLNIFSLAQVNLKITMIQ